MQLQQQALQTSFNSRASVTGTSGGGGNSNRPVPATRSASVPASDSSNMNTGGNIVTTGTGAASSPQHKIISVRTFVNKLNSENSTGGAPGVNKPNVYKKPPELVAKRLGGGTAAGFVNGRELIEKQKNWTMHFKAAGGNDNTTVKVNGNAVNGSAHHHHHLDNNGSSNEASRAFAVRSSVSPKGSPTKEVPPSPIIMSPPVTKPTVQQPPTLIIELPKQQQPTSEQPIVVSVSKVVFKQQPATTTTTTTTSVDSTAKPKPEPPSPQPPVIAKEIPKVVTDHTSPSPVVAAKTLSPQEALKPQQQQPVDPPPEPVLDPPSISITNPCATTSFSSTTTEDEELTTVIDCLGSTSSLLLNGSCSSLNAEFEHGSGSMSGELFKDVGEEEFVEDVREEDEQDQEEDDDVASQQMKQIRKMVGSSVDEGDVLVEKRTVVEPVKEASKKKQEQVRTEKLFKILILTHFDS